MKAPTSRLLQALSLLVLGCTLNAARAEESTVDRATDATKRAAKNTNAWLRHAAGKTDAALDRAADKVGLTNDGRKTNTAAPAGPKSGPRPGG